jgi:hypothetical protein
LAEIRAAGDPLSLAELARPPIPPEKNAATFLRRAEAGAAAIEKELLQTPDFFKQLEAKGPMSADVQSTLTAVFLAHSDVISLLQQAAACPDYDAELDYTVEPGVLNANMLPVVQESRCYARALQYWAQLFIAQGNRDDAVRTVLTMFQLARHFDCNPTIVSYLVAIAVRGMAVDLANQALQTGPVSQEVRDALDGELAAQQRMDGYVWMFKTERAYGIDWFAYSIPPPKLKGYFPSRNFWLLVRGFWNRQESVYLETMKAEIALARDPSPYQKSTHALQAIERQVRQQSFIVQPLIPALQAMHEAVVRNQAMIRCLRVLNALQVRVPAGSDEAPKLSDLGLPAEFTTDPYTGDPLHIKKLPRGWLVYAVGRDFKDHGGELEPFPIKDVGVGPPPAEDKPAEK